MAWASRSPGPRCGALLDALGLEDLSRLVADAGGVASSRTRVAELLGASAAAIGGPEAGSDATGAALLEVTLHTGRTHQIRVHFAYRRHALLGDPVYGGRLALPSGASEALVRALRNFRRQALHAASLELAHPLSGDRIRLSAPLPDDFEELLDVLREDAR